MKNPAYQLIDKLNELNNSDKEFLKQGLYIADEDVLIEEIELLACKALITRQGHPNFTAMNFIEKYCNEISIYPGETDSFGWLTGCIETNKGVIVFG